MDFEIIPKSIKFGLVSGEVEKLVRGKWTPRWITVCYETASLHYYMNKGDQDERRRVRGIYPLTEARVVTEQDGHHYLFIVTLSSWQQIKFRTGDKMTTITWFALIHTLSAKRSQAQDKVLEDSLGLKTSLTWSRRQVSLDPLALTLTIAKSGRDEDDVYLVGGSCVREDKSYGKQFDFVVSCAPAPGGKIGQVKLRASTEGQRDLWVQAIRAASRSKVFMGQDDCDDEDDNDEDEVTVRRTREIIPGEAEVVVVVVEGLRAADLKLCMRINKYLRPNHLLHCGSVSKVYHSTLAQVTWALERVGFIITSEQDDEVEMRLKPTPAGNLRPSCTIEELTRVLTTQPSSPADSPSSASPKPRDKSPSRIASPPPTSASPKSFDASPLPKLASLFITPASPTPISPTPDSPPSPKTLLTPASPTPATPTHVTSTLASSTPVSPTPAVPTPDSPPSPTISPPSLRKKFSSLPYEGRCMSAMYETHL